MNKAKRKHRPSLKDWAKDGFASTRSDAFFSLAEASPSGYIEANPGDWDKCESDLGILRIQCEDLSYDAFVEHFELPERPVIISGVPASDGWPATDEWTFERLRQRLGTRLFKCGEDDDGYKVKVKLRYFLRYCANNQDDSPLYIFDANFDSDADSKSLLRDYSVPKYFPDDLFALVGERRRPPYRWFLLGPQRSGTTVHIDPLGTSAWNTVVSGRKRWILFPPGTPREIAKCTDVRRKGEDDEAINYFIDLVPRLRAKHGPGLRILEFTQLPGDTVFVPGGWWHAVLNLDDTVAVTQVCVSYTRT